MSTLPDQPMTAPVDAEPADVLEQALEAAPAERPAEVPAALDPGEADPADVLEQHLDVPLDDEERDRA